MAIIKALRLPFIIVSATTTLLIWHYLNLPYDKFFIFVITGICLAHISGNLWNDYFDFKSDFINTSPTPFSGGSRVLQERKVSKKLFLTIAIVFSLTSILIGLYLLINFFSIRLLILIILASSLTFFYTGVPFRLIYNYLGEITIFLLFGPFIYIGIKEMFRLSFDYKIFIISVTSGIITMKILLVNQIPDCIYDIKAEKRTITTLLKQKLYYLLLILDIICFITLYIGGFKTLSYIILSILLITDNIIKINWKGKKYEISSFITILSFILVSSILFVSKGFTNH